MKQLPRDEQSPSAHLLDLSKQNIANNQNHQRVNSLYNETSRQDATLVTLNKDHHQR